MKVFVLSTGWLGGVVGLILVAQRRGRWTDYFCGLLAGAGAGLAASATLGCVLSRLWILCRDSAAKTAHVRLCNRGGYRRELATPLWDWCWLALSLDAVPRGAALGAVLTLLAVLLGARVAVDLAGLSACVRLLRGLCGLNGLAEVFSSGG